MLDLQRRIRILCLDLVGFLHLAFAFAPLILFLLMLLLRAFMFFTDLAALEFVLSQQRCGFYLWFIVFAVALHS